MDDHLDQGFVQQHSLRFEALAGAAQIRISGHIACLGRVVISVVKYLDILSDDTNPWVVTTRYAYQAFVANRNGFLRHDNAPHHGHEDDHHYHQADWRAAEDGDPIWCGEKGWPNLSEFIDKVARWYDDHRDELPEPDGVVTTDELTEYDKRTSLLE